MQFYTTLQTRLGSQVHMIPGIRQILDIYGLTAQKHLSQNFILNTVLLDKIASLVKGSRVLEIGPGPGGLTRSLLRLQPPRNLLAIELDRRFEPVLQQLKETYGARFTPIFTDALSVDFKELLAQPTDGQIELFSIVGNLPFGIASRLLQRLLDNFDCLDTIPHEFLLMFQKEVAERIAAKPGTKHYGRLAISAQNAYNVSIQMALPSSDFVPKPKVDAAVVRFTAKMDESRPSYPDLSFLTSKAFLRPKRMIFGILKGYIPDLTWDPSLPSPSARPTALSVSEYQRLCLWLRLEHSSFFPSPKLA